MIIWFVNGRAIFKMELVESACSFLSGWSSELTSELWLFTRNESANVTISYSVEIDWHQDAAECLWRWWWWWYKYFAASLLMVAEAV